MNALLIIAFAAVIAAAYGIPSYGIGLIGERYVGSALGLRYDDGVKYVGSGITGRYPDGIKYVGSGITGRYPDGIKYVGSALGLRYDDGGKYVSSAVAPRLILGYGGLGGLGWGIGGYKG